MKKLFLFLCFLLVAVSGFCEHIDYMNMADGHFSAKVDGKQFTNLKDFEAYHENQSQNYIPNTKYLDPNKKPFHMENGKIVWDDNFHAIKQIPRLTEWGFMDFLMNGIFWVGLFFGGLYFLKARHEGRAKEFYYNFALVLLGGWIFNYFRYTLPYHTNFGCGTWANWEDLAFIGMLVYLYFITSMFSKDQNTKPKYREEELSYCMNQGSFLSFTLKWISRFCLVLIFLITLTSGNFLKGQWGKLNAALIPTVISAASGAVPAWVLNITTPELNGGGTGVSDNTTALNAMVTQMYTTGATAFLLGNGTYNMTTGCIKMFHVNNAGTSFVAWNGAKMIGFGYPDGSTGAYPVISQAVTNLPCMVTQYLYGAHFQGFTLAGQASWSADPNAYQAKFYLNSRGVSYTRGCLDLQEATHGGIVDSIFSYTGSSPITYTNSFLTPYYNLQNAGDSHNILVENVGFNGLVTGYLECPGDDGLGDSVHLVHCVWNFCQYGVAKGNNQDDGDSIDDPAASYMLAFICETQYGDKQGSGWTVGGGGEINTFCYLVDGSYDNEMPSSYSNFYCEGLWSIGFIGGGGGARTYAFSSINFNYFVGQDGTTRSRDSFAYINGNVDFNDCMFSDGNGFNNAIYRMNFANSQARVRMNDCNGGLDPTYENGIAGFFGDMNNFFRFTDFSYFNSSSSSSANFNNDGTEYPIAGQLLCPNTTFEIGDSNTYYNPASILYVPVTIDGNGTGYTPSATNNGGCTFLTFENNPLVEPGDVLFSPSAFIDVESSSAAGVTSVINNRYAFGEVIASNSTSISCNYAPVTTNVNGSMVLYSPIYDGHIPKWHKLFAATATSGSSVLTNCYTVSSTGVTAAYSASDWAQYDWIYDGGKCLANGGVDRVLGTNGSGSITVQSNATASGTIYPYDAQYVKTSYSCLAAGNTNGPVSIGGTAGYGLWTEGQQSQDRKTFTLTLNGYTNTSPVTITYPLAFAVAPTTSDSIAGITFTVSTTSLIIPIIASAATDTLEFKSVR